MGDIGFNLNHATRSEQDDWEVDGLLTIAYAFLLLIPIAAESWMPVGSFWTLLLWILIEAAYIYFVARPASFAIRWLKGRIIYPRVGYAAPSPAIRSGTQAMERPPDMWMLVFMWAPGMFANSWIGALLMIGGASFVWRWSRGRFPSAVIRIPGYYLSAFLVAVLPISRKDRPLFLFTAFGLLFLLSGITQLVSYLHRHPLSRA